jgi:GAF domain-containing protein
MSLRNELINEYKSLLSSFEEIKLVAGETDLLNQMKRVLSLSSKCIDIMGKVKPTKPIGPPKRGKNLGKTLYTRDRRTTAAPSVGYLESFTGEKNIENKFVSNREMLVRKLNAQTALADKMKFQTKVYYTKMELEMEKHNRVERVSSGKLTNALNDKKRLLKICKKQEYTIDEQKRIIEGLKYKLKRRWDTDPIIDISPRTRNLAKTVLGQKSKSAKQNFETDPLTGKKKAMKKTTKKKKKLSNNNSNNDNPKNAEKKQTDEKNVQPVDDANDAPKGEEQQTGQDQQEQQNQELKQPEEFQKPKKITLEEAEKTNIIKHLKNAVLSCIQNVLQSKSVIEKWKALEYLPLSFFNCYSSRLYIVDADRQQLVRYTLTEIEDIGGNSNEYLNYTENRYQLIDGKCVHGNVGAVYRGYGIDVVRGNSNGGLGGSVLVSGELTELKFVAYAPAKSVMVVPFLSQSGSIFGCFECTNVNENFNKVDLKNAELLALQLSTFLAFDKRNETLITRLEGKGMLLAALKPENLAELSLPKLLKSLTIKTKEVLNAERCVWYILDKDRGVLWSRLPNEGQKLKVRLNSEGIVGHVFRERKSINIEDIDRYHDEVEKNKGIIFEDLVSKDYKSIVGRVKSTLVMPMIGEDKSIMGVVQVFNKLNSSIGFNAEDEINLRIISDHGSIAIENAAILQETRNSHSIGLDFSSDVQAIDVLDRVIQMSVKDTHAQHGVIYMYKHGDSFMQLYNPHHHCSKNGKGVIQDDKGAGVEWTSVDTNCIAGNSATTGKTIILSDGTVRYDQRFNKEVNKLAMGLDDAKVAMEMNRATLCEPVHDQDGNVIAVLQVINKNEKYRERGAFSFDRTDSLRLHRIANIAAISLQNALLHEEATNSQWRLHELLECTLALTKEHHLPTLLTMINQHAKDVLEAEACTMWLVEGEKEKKLVMNRNTDEEYRGAVSVSLSDDILGQVATSREVLVIGKEQHGRDDESVENEGIVVDSMDKEVRSALYIPMISSHDDVMGVIHLKNKLGGRHFSHEDMTLAKAFSAQAATAIENVHMFQHLAQLRAYSKSISPTTNNFVFSLDVHGHLEHASHNPKYVLGLDMEFMRTEPYHKWLGHRNHILEHHLERAYRLKKAVSAQLTNAVYHNQHGQTTVTNVAIVPRFSVELDLDGVVVTMTQIKRHATLSIMESRFRNNVSRIPWPKDKTMPHRYIYTTKEPKAEPLHCDDEKVVRKYMETETVILCIAVNLIFDEYPPKSGGHDSQEATIGSHHILRDIQRSTFKLQEEDYDVSDANGSTSEKTSMARLSAQDFLRKFIFDATCLINENKGIIDRIYNTNIIVASFGIQRENDVTKEDVYADTSCQMAIKITDLAHAFQSELTQYYDTHYSGKLKPWLNVHCGVHSCIAHFTQPIEDEETDNIDEDKEEDAPQIYRLMDEDIDLGIEMVLAGAKLGISRVVSPHAAALFNKKLSKKELIMRKIDTVHSIVLNSNSSVFELVAYQELGFHKPGFLRSMKYFENGLDAYEGGDYAVALSRFQQAYTLSKDSLTLLYIDRCKDRV